MKWDSMTGVAGHMDVKYDGGDADRHLLDSAQYARSVDGSGRLYRLVSHYCLHGEVLSGKKQSDLRCFSAPQGRGHSSQHWLYLQHFLINTLLSMTSTKRRSIGWWQR
ncbi:DUF7946 domain-containing protein [Pseudomonas vancouverensis]